MSREAEPDLTAPESEELYQELVALREVLGRAVAGFRDAAKPVDLDQPIGRVSRMDAIQQQQMARASREGLALRVKQVGAALDRIAEGTYGACVVCEENVGYARLKARPETPLCIACQTRREQR
jgi:DnaK suppressor protein